MASLAPRMILAVATVGILVTNIANAYIECSPTLYGRGSDLESYIHTVLKSIRDETAYSPNRAFSIQYPSGNDSPNVIGLSTCSTDIETDACNSCISGAIQELKNTCGRAVFAKNLKDDCELGYFTQWP